MCVSGSGISWAICKSAPRFRQITTPAPTTQFFTRRMPLLLPNQQRQSTEAWSLWQQKKSYRRTCWWKLQARASSCRVYISTKLEWMNQIANLPLTSCMCSFLPTVLVLRKGVRVVRRSDRGGGIAAASVQADRDGVASGWTCCNRSRNQHYHSADTTHPVRVAL